MPPTRSSVRTLQKRRSYKNSTLAISINDTPKDLALCEIEYPLDAPTRAAFRTCDGKKLTAHQWAVYDLARKIPQGRVTTYGALCKMLDAGSARSVGNALRRNPFAPFVPCHRVIASNLYIGGFFGEWGTVGTGAQGGAVKNLEDAVQSGDRGRETVHEGRQCQKKVEMLAMEGVGFTLDGYLADECLLWRG